MKPSDFEQTNKRLLPPKGEEDEIKTLGVWTDGLQCVSLWRPSWRERLSILFFGKVWLALLSGSTQPPAYVAGCRNFFAKEKQR